MAIWIHEADAFREDYSSCKEARTCKFARGCAGLLPSHGRCPVHANICLRCIYSLQRKRRRRRPETGGSASIRRAIGPRERGARSA